VRWQGTGAELPSCCRCLSVPLFLLGLSRASRKAEAGSAPGHPWALAGFCLESLLARAGSRVETRSGRPVRELGGACRAALGEGWPERGASWSLFPRTKPQVEVLSDNRSSFLSFFLFV